LCQQTPRQKQADEGQRNYFLHFIVYFVLDTNLGKNQGQKAEFLVFFLFECCNFQYFTEKVLTTTTLGLIGFPLCVLYGLRV